ncbi:hypothetical protein GCM10023149_33380 [Mucilaginibacter gynuensis]|uniref:2'-5' RNA ligase family protein n=1 Tax=Mucilaginibacter gynuensis TaxID=1302236 RepID=A0ABP8GSE5_9SPHI
MQVNEKRPLILTLSIDPDGQAFFEMQRKRYFPPERNFLAAHLNLFHQLPDDPATYDYLAGLRIRSFELNVIRLMHLGAGVAYRIDGPELISLHRMLSSHFSKDLIPQDRQGFRPHITISNKTTPENASELLKQLSGDFKPFKIQATGLDLWTYLDGPWRHERTFSFEL